MTDPIPDSEVGGKPKVMTTTWTVASNKPTEFGFSYRWYLPRFVYSMVMHDLKFIRRNRKVIYKKKDTL